MRLPQDGLEEITLLSALNLPDPAALAHVEVPAAAPVPAEIPTSKEEIKKEAVKVKEKVAQTEKSFEKSKKSLQTVAEKLFKRRSDLLVPMAVDEDEVLHHDGYVRIVSKILTIVDKYVDGEFDMMESHEDSVVLQANLIYLSRHLSFANSRFEMGKASIDPLKGRSYLAAKEIANEDGIRLTDTDAKEMARADVADLTAEVYAMGVYQSYLFNTYMSVMKFVEMLNNAANREFRINAMKPPG